MPATWGGGGGGHLTAPVPLAQNRLSFEKIFISIFG